MALSETVSTMVSAVLALLVFSGMMTFKGILAATQLGTILGGYVGSIFFILILTSLGNLQMAMFGDRFHTKLFPEVMGCLGVSVVVSALVHRVCGTTCLLFSLMGLHYMNRISQDTYNIPATHQNPGPEKKKKK